MTFTPDKRLLAALLAALAIGGPLAAAAGSDAIAEALVALERGDGIAAEIAAKRALEEGAPRNQVAALVGEGEFLQGDLRDARSWLGDGDFDSATLQRGLHTFARLELAEGNFTAAAQAFDRLLQEDLGTALIWVDIGRMRYLAGEHFAALEAANEAVRLDPQEPRAVEFLAQLVRDGQGLNASLPYFRQATDAAPDDTNLLAQYGATLGDAGQHAQMLETVRQLLAKDGANLYAYYLQAILAARAGEDDLARRIWWRTDGAFDTTAAGMLVSGILEFRSGNHALAVENFDKVRRMQPSSQTAMLLYGRALVADGDANVAVALLEPHAQRPDASAYLLTLVARGHEQMGQREQAAPYLDRAARLARAARLPIPAFLPRDDFGGVRDRDNPVMRLRELVSEGRHADARTLVAELMESFAGSVDLQLAAGDVELLAGNSAAALEYYGQASLVRTNWPLIRRMAAAQLLAGDDGQARAVLADHLVQNPRDQAALAMLGRMQRDAGNPARATVLLRQAASLGSGPVDPLLLADLAEMELVLDNRDEAASHARAAHVLHRSNRRVAQTLARVVQMSGGDSGVSQALFAKSRGRGFAD